MSGCGIGVLTFLLASGIVAEKDGAMKGMKGLKYELLCLDETFLPNY